MWWALLGLCCRSVSITQSVRLHHTYGLAAVADDVAGVVEVVGLFLNESLKRFQALLRPFFSFFCAFEVSMTAKV
jgi:hypothetical protein